MRPEAGNQGKPARDSACIRNEVRHSRAARPTQKARPLATNPIRFIQKGARILRHRLRDHGLRTTFVWAYGRGIAKVTGVPPLQYSRVTPYLYVGPQYTARGKRHLEKNGITAGVNMRVEFDDAAHGLAFVRYCHLPTVDDAAPSLADLSAGARFIGAEIAAGGSVYIHCAGGIGRAPTMAAAYLISTGKTLEESLTLIKRVRPFILLTPAQLEQLKEFEETLGKDRRPS